jgi:GTP-binding protein
MTFTVAIVGRPNVGKSTLFNRLVGKRLALVDDTPGVTRDRREGEGRLFELRFTAVDTAGFEAAYDSSLEARMRAQTEQAVAEADLVLLLIDARAGVTPLDRHFADWLRRSETPVALVANKCESRAGDAGLAEAYALGLGGPVPVSAEHGLGLSDLYDRVKATMDAAVGQSRAEAAESELAPEDGDKSLQLAIVGRPNVGKSTLINRLLGEERLLTGPEAGITRDSIAVEWSHKGRPIRLIDTAGLRRKARIAQKLEKLSASDALRAIDFAQVVILLLDAEAPMEKQDLNIARRVIDEGRALVIALNKWDACADRKGTLAALSDRLERSLSQTKGLPVVPISALKGDKLDKLLDAAVAAYDVWNRRVPTSELNRWLAAVTQAHPPPAPGGRRIRLKYMTQARARPPTFAISCTKADALPDSYLRYLENALRQDFDLPGTPIRLHLKKGKNPYTDKKKRA